MLWSIKSLRGYTILALDGEIGRTKEFLFDDQHWLLTYFVVNTSKVLSRRKVLISPLAIRQPRWEAHVFPVDLTREQIKNSPAIDEAQPISRQYQTQLHDYYAWPYYWQIVARQPTYQVSDFPKSEDQELLEQTQEGDPHLRSTQEIIGYHVHALDGEIGHVEDFIVDDTLWLLRYIVIDTQNWLPGKKVLIPLNWIQRMSWLEKEVYFDLTRETIQQCPEYDPTQPVNRQYEIRFYDYYGRPKYWEGAEAALHQ